jgi:hypothetical protein
VWQFLGCGALKDAQVGFTEDRKRKSIGGLVNEANYKFACFASVFHNGGIFQMEDL